MPLAPTAPSRWTFGAGFVYDFDRKSLTKDGKVIILQRRTRDVLEVFLKHNGKVLEWRDIKREVQRAGQDKVVVASGRARARLGEGDENRQPVQTQLDKLTAAPREVDTEFTLRNPGGGYLLEAEPDRDEPSLLADSAIGGFTVQPKPVHVGLFADIYKATSSSSSGYFAVHLPRRALLHDVELRSYFSRRAPNWLVLSQRVASVAPPDQASQGGASVLEPFLAIPWLEGSTVDNLVQRRRAPSDPELLAIVRAAIELCESAEKCRLVLMALPFRHILRSSDGTIRFVGLDSLVPAQETLPDRTLLRFLYGRDYGDFAPENLAGGMVPHPTSDVWAIGKLLERLGYETGVHPAPWRSRPDALQCLALHCTARLPIDRFHSACHLNRAFRTWVDSAEPVVPAIHWRGLAVAEFPVTNFEYETYCRAKGKTSSTGSLPPFAPVVNVSFRTAQVYCRWFAAKTRQPWRLPKADECFDCCDTDPTGRRVASLWEWRDDQSLPGIRVVRQCGSTPKAASRNESMEARRPDIGFRMVRETGAGVE